MPALRGSLVGGLAVIALASGLLLADETPSRSTAPVEAPARKSAATPKTSPAKKGSRPRYESRTHHDPNGIGKFYFGREIARVMGFDGVQWLERPERETEEHLDQLVESLNLTPGMVVADIGAGSGVISIKMAAKVGPSGTILAVDIQDEMLSVLGKKLEQLKITNVTPVRGTEKSPKLDPASVDLVIMVDVYHELRFPYEMLLQISKALKPGGRVVFVEYRKEDPSVPIKLLHKMNQAQVKREAGQPEFGLKWIETKNVLPRQHVILFERIAAPEK
jgi:precorrin-6B methylase 2